MKILIRFICPIVFFIASQLFASTYNVADYGDNSMSVTNFNSALTAASPGDIIMFSGADAMWSASATVGKAVTIDGNGTTLTSSGALTNGFFYIIGFTDNLNLMRITRFTFTGVSNTVPSRMIHTEAIDLESLRIDHNTFNQGSAQLEIAGVHGVIDNNNFYNAGADWILTSAGTRTQQDASWADMTPGTANALFIEDNVFYYDVNWSGPDYTGAGIDGYGGGKVVYRHNEFDADDFPTPANNVGIAGPHGSALDYWVKDTANARRSPSLLEFYENNIHGSRIDRMFSMRGGSGLIYNNSITTSTGTTVILLREEEYYEAAWSPIRVNWPAEDQVHNTFIWGNTFNGSGQSTSNVEIDDFNYSVCTGVDTPWDCCTGLYTGTCRDIDTNPAIQKDRDFFLHAPCEYDNATDGYGNTCTFGIETFTDLNGASGSNPTDGDPYPDNGTMVFTADVDNAYYGYTPYTYPHPLRGVGLITVSNINSGGLTITIPGSLTISNIGA